MKRLTIIALLVFCSILAGAQEQVADSLVYKLAPSENSLLSGKSIFNLMPSKAKGDRADVTIEQSEDIFAAMQGHIAANPSRSISGYRLRIFSDNKQTSRTDSENVLKSFSSAYPGVAAYRTYQAPFFRVTVGDFRTKSEARELLQQLIRDYPAAFVVKENINYPVADKSHSYIVDTVRISL